ncbi:restriction endonuclease [Vibrio sp. Vb2135]|uniref:restriction endonuclease n=1 Tax=Vibrio sp. Vb2135 TaxID=3074653 RepID=UPI002964E7FC|nr:restriction endonuclease [Vibrio sp. Vb2135]MDW1762239.1 restriction endonuclease [Vibrio sp. Vb2135]
MLGMIKSWFDTSGSTCNIVQSKDLRQAVIDTLSNEQWFKEHFADISDLPQPEEGQPYRHYTYILSSYIRDAIIKDFLIKKEYLPKLMLKRRQLIYKDAYGDYVFDDWFRELKNFTQKREDYITSHLLSLTPDFLVTELRATERWDNYIFEGEYLTDDMWSVVDNVLDFIESDEEEIPNLSFDTDNPYEYEHIIAQKLTELGWNAHPTSGSGDQGADVIAEKYGIVFVIQCKLYSQPVGNKAVQEVTSARDYYDASGAVVVTNNDYTKSARQLAESQTVWLLHDSQLEEWDSAIEEMINDSLEDTE